MKADLEIELINPIVVEITFPSVFSIEAETTIAVVVKSRISRKLLVAVAVEPIAENRLFDTPILIDTAVIAIFGRYSLKKSFSIVTLEVALIVVINCRNIALTDTILEESASEEDKDL